MPNNLSKLTDDELLEEERQANIPDSQELSLMSDEDILALEKATDKEFERKEALKGVSTASSFLTGVEQGATLGFSDEIEGTIKAGIRKIQGDETPYEDAYLQERDIARERIAFETEANPIAAGLGSGIGGIASVLATGGTAAGYRAAAVIGGLSGVGFTDSGPGFDKGSDLVKNTFIGSALGLGGEKVFRGIGGLINKLTARTSPPTNAILTAVGETRIPQNVSFETGIYRQALRGGFKDMDSFFSSQEAQRSAATWAQDAHNIPKDLLRQRSMTANAKLKAVLSAPENQNKSINISQTVDEMAESLKEFRSSGQQKNAVNVMNKEIFDPLTEGKLRLGGELADPTNLTFQQSIEFKRLVSELTFKNADPLLDTAEQFAFRKAPAVSARLNKFAGNIIEQTNAADGTGILKNVNEDLFNIINAEKLAPRNLKELQSLSADFGDNKAFFRGQEFLLALDQVDDRIKAEVAQEIVPILTLTDAISTARQWNLGVSTLFQAKAGAAAIGPIGALVALGKGGTLLTTQAVGKAAKAAFKIPRTVAGIIKDREIIIQKISDLSPAVAIQLNDLIVDRNAEGIKQLAISALQDPAIVAEFEPGLGFEGQITSPEEADQVRNQVMSSKATLAEKIRAVTEVDQKGIIPQVDESPIPPREGRILLNIQRGRGQENLNLVRKTEKELDEE